MRDAEIPEKIEKLTAGMGYTADKTGMSGDEIRLYRDMVLKISRDDETARREAASMEWLRGRLPVPEILACERGGGRQFLLMERISGVMLCDKSVISDPLRVTRLLAQALEMVQGVDITGCPCRADLDMELALARKHVERGEVDTENVEPSTFGPGGFRDPEHLLGWLEENRPEEEFVFTHGDMCLPNIFTGNGGISGFLDLGGAGIGDRYRDISIARRSLHDNTDGHHGHTSPGFDADALFDCLGLRPDREKLRYYLLLDELF